jgi:hypothetical protein
MTRIPLNNVTMSPMPRGPWVIDEVRMAVEKGYKVLEIHEIYEY